MKRHWKLLLFAIFVVAALSLTPTDVQAYYYNEWNDEESLRVIIDDAYYADYDNDGMEDDIITTFRIYVHWDDDERTHKVEVSCEIETPSGITYEYGFVERTRNGFKATLVWLNTANEPGWYDLRVWAELEYMRDYEKLTFDPPGGGDKGELPGITIYSIEHF